MNRLTRISATVASSALLVAGFAGVAGASADVLDTGNRSNNVITQTDRTRNRVDNNSDVRAFNNNPQIATSGSAELHENRDGGNVRSGVAANTSDTLSDVDINYRAVPAATTGTGGSTASPAAVSDATINGTGNDSDNTITTRRTVRTTVNNDSTVRVENNNSQTATSGNASAHDNTTAGDVASGNASNDSLTTLNVKLTY